MSHENDMVGQWRSLFPVTKNWVYLNHAGVAPISQPVYDAITGLARDVLVDGVANVAVWWEHYAVIRQRAADLMQVSTRNIAFVKNTSEGLSFVASGYPWRDGDQVLTAAMEFPSNRFPWLALADKGVETTIIPDEAGRVPVDLYAERVTAKTRLLAVSAVQYASGYRADLAALGGLCRENDMLYVVDGIQALGAMPLYPEDYGIDVVVADSHKWMLGPEGIGVMYISDRAMDMLRVTEIGWHTSEAPLEFERQELVMHDDARRFECGTPTGVALYGFGAALKVLLDVGLDEIGRRTMMLGDYLRDACRSRGWSVYGPQKPEETSPVVCVETRGDVDGIAEGLKSMGVLAAARAGNLRFSPHFYNTTDEIDTALERLESLL